MVLVVLSHCVPLASGLPLMSLGFLMLKLVKNKSFYLKIALIMEKGVLNTG